MPKARGLPQYSVAFGLLLMEFMREFPDDAACLEWLWRNRYSPDGEQALCPKCDAERNALNTAPRCCII